MVRARAGKHKHEVAGEKTAVGRPVGRLLHDHLLPGGGRTPASNNSVDHDHKGTVGKPVSVRV